jgi:hypothetical protein
MEMVDGDACSTAKWAGHKIGNENQPGTFGVATFHWGYVPAGGGGAGGWVIKSNDCSMLRWLPSLLCILSTKFNDPQLSNSELKIGLRLTENTNSPLQTQFYELNLR